LQAPGDAAFAQIVGRHFHLDAVADSQANPALAHFSADGGEDEVFVVEFNAEHRASQHGLHLSDYFDVFFFQSVRFCWSLLKRTSERPSESEAIRKSRPG